MEFFMRIGQTQEPLRQITCIVVKTCDDASIIDAVCVRCKTVWGIKDRELPRRIAHETSWPRTARTCPRDGSCCINTKRGSCKAPGDIEQRECTLRGANKQVIPPGG